jgi:hypothetical protein
MLGNVTQKFVIKVKNPSTVTITPLAIADISLTVMGADPTTDHVLHVGFNPTLLFDHDLGMQIASWISAKNIVKVRFFNAAPNTTSLNVLTGKFVYITIARVDNGAKGDGLGL